MATKVVKDVGSVAEQIAVIRNLRQEPAAELLGCSVRTLRRRDDLPVVQFSARTLLYDGPSLVKLWLAEAKGGDGEDLAGWDEDHKKAYIVARTRAAEAQADKVEYDLAVKRGALLRREVVERLLGELASGLREVTRVVYEQWGEEARLLLDGMLKRVESVVLEGENPEDDEIPAMGRGRKDG